MSKPSLFTIPIQTVTNVTKLYHNTYRWIGQLTDLITLNCNQCNQKITSHFTISLTRDYAWAGHIAFPKARPNVTNVTKIQRVRLNNYFSHYGGYHEKY